MIRFAVNILFLLLITGCADIVDNNDPGNIVKDIILTDSLGDKSIYTDPAIILSVKIDEDVLIMRVGYSGGCKEHFLELYSVKTFKESNPVQLDLRLSHNGNGDLCDAFITDTLYFNLNVVKNLYRTAYGNGSGEISLNLNNPSMEVFIPKPLYRF